MLDNPTVMLTHTHSSNSITSITQAVHHQLYQFKKQMTESQRQDAIKYFLHCSNRLKVEVPETQWWCMYSCQSLLQPDNSFVSTNNTSMCPSKTTLHSIHTHAADVIQADSISCYLDDQKWVMHR